jgi:hypothetical protein
VCANKELPTKRCKTGPAARGAKKKKKMSRHSAGRVVDFFRGKKVTMAHHLPWVLQPQEHEWDGFVGQSLPWTHLPMWSEVSQDIMAVSTRDAGRCSPQHTASLRMSVVECLVSPLQCCSGCTAQGQQGALAVGIA